MSDIATAFTAAAEPPKASAKPKAVAPKIADQIAEPAATELPAPVSAPKSGRKIHPSRFKNAEQERQIWMIVPEHGTSFEDLLEPPYWAHVSKFLKPNAHIEIAPEDASYFAELIVRSVGLMSAHVAVLRHIELGQVPLPAAQSFAVEYRGPLMKHSVIRKRDGYAIATGYDTQDAAFQWLAANSRTLAA